MVIFSPAAQPFQTVGSVHIVKYQRTKGREERTGRNAAEPDLRFAGIPDQHGKRRPWTEITSFGTSASGPSVVTIGLVVVF